ncbi:hypothetical protein HY745_08410 [Candidatus Desantisbacteria bacterium]|nr:hypothetical protein [Candidatus Desantisbacteria bacterium]
MSFDQNPVKVYDNERIGMIGDEVVNGTFVASTILEEFTEFDVEKIVQEEEADKSEIRTSPFSTGEVIRTTVRGDINIGQLLRPNSKVFNRIMKFLGENYVMTPPLATLRRSHMTIPGYNPPAGGISLEQVIGGLYNKLATGGMPNKFDITLDAGKKIEYKMSGGCKNVVTLENKTTGLTDATRKAPYMFSHAYGYMDNLSTPVKIQKMVLSLDLKRVLDSFVLGSINPDEFFKDGTIYSSAFSLKIEKFLASADFWTLFHAGNSMLVKYVLTHGDTIETVGQDGNKYMHTATMPRVMLKKDPTPKSKTGGKRTQESLDCKLLGINEANCGDNDNLIIKVFTYDLSEVTFYDKTASAKDLGANYFDMFSDTATAESGDYCVILSKIPIEVVYFKIITPAVGLVFGTNAEIRYTSDGASSLDKLGKIIYDGTLNMTQDGYIVIERPTDMGVGTINSVQGIGLGIKCIGAGITTEPNIDQIVIYNAPPVYFETIDTLTV